MEIVKSILSILIVFLPIVFWGYLFSYAQNTKLSATRFFVGILAGSLSVIPIVHAKEIFEYFSVQSVFSFLMKSGFSPEFVASFLLSYGLPIGLFLVVLVAIFFRQIAGRIGLIFRSLAVIASFAGVFCLAYLLFAGKGSAGDTQVELLGSVLASFSSIVLAYLFIGALEESTKHLALYPSLETDLSHPKYIALATAFTALGFSFLENVYYLIHLALDNGIFSGAFFGTLVSRSIVSLLLHVFAALILTLGFGKYLGARTGNTYFRFFIAFLVAVGVHALFDISLTYGKTGIIAVYAIIGYFFFTKVFFDERNA